MQIDVQLINESQYGTRLNHAIESNRRGEFGLLLAMMSADASDMAQFQLDKDKTIDEKLRHQFEIVNQQPLIKSIQTATSSIKNAQTFVAEGSRSFQLRQALNPDALVIRGEQSLDMCEVLNNCDWVTRLKQQGRVKTPMVAIDHFADQLAEQRQYSIAV